MPITAKELAELLKGTLVGNPDTILTSCNTLSAATPSDVSLFHNSKYLKDLEATKAGCVICAPGTLKNLTRDPALPPLAAIEVKDIYYAWQQSLVKLLGHRQHPTVGISPLASIHPSAKIGANCNIHPFVVISENVTIGDNVNLFPHVTLLHSVSIGNDTTLYPSVTVYERCKIGNRCLIHAGTCIGNDGSSYAQGGGVHHKVPQNGIAIIEDDVEIMANAIVERAVLETTIVGKGSKVGSCAIIGHNCHIGIGNMIIGGVCIAGSTNTGKYVVVGGQAGISGHLNIPDFVTIAAQSGVMADPETKTTIAGTPAMEAGHALRVYALFTKLPELNKRIKDLEKQLAKLQPPTE